MDDQGLDRLDQSILRTLIDKFGGGPVGLSTLAAAVGEETDTVEDVVEPYLLQLGFLRRTPRGRVATEHAYRHLGASVPGTLPLVGRTRRREVDSLVPSTEVSHARYPRPDTTQPNPIVGFLPLLLIGVVFYFLLIRPQNQRRRAQMEMQSVDRGGRRGRDHGGDLRHDHRDRRRLRDRDARGRPEHRDPAGPRGRRARAWSTTTSSTTRTRWKAPSRGRERPGSASRSRGPAAAVRTPDEPAPRMPVEPVPTRAGTDARRTAGAGDRHARGRPGERGALALHRRPPTA